MKPSLYEDIKDILKRYYGRFLLSFTMVLIANCLVILNPLVLREAINAVTLNTQAENTFIARHAQYFFGDYYVSIWPWVALLLVIALISSCFRFLMRISFITISRDKEKEIRSDVFGQIQKQSKAFYDKYGIGELMSRLTNDISSYRDLLGPGIMYPLNFITIIVPGVIALFYISKELALITTIPLIALPIVNSFVREKMYNLSLKVQQYLGTLSNMTQEHYSGIKIIKGYGVENNFLKKFHTLCLQLQHQNFLLMSLQGLLLPFFYFLTKIVTAVLVLFAAGMILKNWGRLDVADFISFMWLQSYIMFPILILSWLLPIYERGRASYDRLVEIYFEPIEVQDNAEKSVKIPPDADIVFKNLSFSYPMQKHPVLKKINLEIPSGTFLGLTGPIGSGKTTLFRLLNREYEIPEGMIYIGGKDIHEYSLEALTETFVTVEQLPFLFSKSIADNVRFGRQEASLEEVELVSQFADLHSSIVDFPEKYETVIGERGITLSGGQKQRLAMARAFLVNRSILLFDDIFSAIDVKTEKKIFDLMKKNFAHKTVILISHRVSILEKLDRVIYLSHGEVLEDGPPKELIKKKGHFAALAELQSLKEQEDDK